MINFLYEERHSYKMHTKKVVIMIEMLKSLYFTNSLKGIYNIN